jgi:hypothetical protein
MSAGAEDKNRQLAGPGLGARSCADTSYLRDELKPRTVGLIAPGAEGGS